MVLHLRDDGICKLFSTCRKVFDYSWIADVERDFDCYVEVVIFGFAGSDTMDGLAGADTLTGGTYEVQAGSIMDFGTNGPIAVNAAEIILSGAGSVLAAVDSLAENSGSFTVADGRNFTTAGSLVNAGELLVGAGSVFTVAGALTGGSGTTTLEAGARLTASYIRQSSLVIHGAAGGSPAAVPEPGTGALAVIAILVLIGCRRNTRRTNPGESRRLST